MSDNNSDGCGLFLVVIILGSCLIQACDDTKKNRDAIKRIEQHLKIESSFPEEETDG